jgi:polar amino acid transport system substrate-binding protein
MLNFRKLERFLFQLALLILTACSCGEKYSGPPVRLGVDPTWAPLSFGEQQSYVNGYTEDMLLEISRYSGLKFEKMTANSSTLFDGLQRGQYDAVLTSLPPYSFNLAKYDFSENFLNTGPVLLTAKISSYKQLGDIPADNLIGILRNDPAALLITAHPKLIVRNYDSIPSLLDAAVAGEVAGVLLDRLRAAAFVRDLYQQTLQVASGPLTGEGLHLLQRKSASSAVMRLFKKSLQALDEQKKVEVLQKKWQLG